jgi:hypothetical protein
MGWWSGAIRIRLDWPLHRDRRSFRAFHSLIRAWLAGVGTVGPAH